MTFRLKKKDLFEVQSNSFRYFFEKSEKSEVEVTTGLFTRLIIDVRISDVTTGELQIVSTSLQI